MPLGLLCQPFSFHIADRHREDENAPVIGFQTGADQFDHFCRHVPAGEIEGNPHRGTAGGMVEQAHGFWLLSVICELYRVLVEI